MKRPCLVCLFVFLAAPLLLSQSNSALLSNPLSSQNANASPADPNAQAKILDSYGKLPLSFEANRGQTDAQVRFLSRTSGYSLFLTGDEAVLALSSKQVKKGKGTASAVPFAVKKMRAIAPEGPTPVLRMKLRNANPAAKATGLDELAGMSNYFIGNDPAKWRTNVPTYAKVKYEGIYPGIDLVYYGNQRQLEYDFIVAPGADPRRIVFDVGGAKRIRRNAQGELVFKVGEGEIRWHKPVVYQKRDGKRQLVGAHYAIRDTNRVAFELAKYDANWPLFIDPLIYSTYIGGSGNDQANGIALDGTGNAYITGTTDSANFPTMNPFQPNLAGGEDAFVVKINPSGSALVYATYLGGSFADVGNGIAVDNSGNAYVTGETDSPDFPTVNPFQSAPGGVFVTKLNPGGSALVYSTFLGGSAGDFGFAIAVDGGRHAYVTGYTGSTAFPVTAGAFQATCGGGANCSESGDAFVTKFNAAGSALVYSTYLGGDGFDRAFGIAVDSKSDAYVTGATNSDNFPTMNPLQPHLVQGDDAFVAKLNASGSALVYSTYLGGHGSDVGSGIALDSGGNAYVSGATTSTDFPTKNPLQAANGGAFKYDVFVTKINPLGSALVYSTYLGARNEDYGQGIAVDSVGNAYVVGTTDSTNFPTVSSLQKEAGAFDAFVFKINAAGSALVYSTFLGGNGSDWGYGIALDSAGNAYITGSTQSANFPTMNPLQPASGGAYDVFVAKLNIAAKTATTLSSSPNPSTYGQAVTFAAAITSSAGAPPDGETVTFMNGKTVLGTGALSGGVANFTTSTLKVGTRLIKAVYGGDSKFGGSKSTPLAQVVNKAAE